MMHVSSNMTLMFRFFIPILYTSFFGCFTAAVWFSELIPYVSFLPPTIFKYAMTAFFVIMVLFFYLTIWRLKRVEMDHESILVSDYWKHAKYSWEGVKSISESGFLFFNVVTIRLHSKGVFGKTIRFIPSKTRFQQFWTMHPTLAKEMQHVAD